MKIKIFFLIIIFTFFLCILTLLLVYSTPKEVTIINGFVLVEGGDFIAGSPANEFLRYSKGGIEDQKNISVNAFYLSQYEVTQKEYAEIMGNNPSTFIGDNVPVHNVTWYDAINFCNRKSLKQGLEPVYKITNDKIDEFDRTEPFQWLYINDYLTVETNKLANGYRLPTSFEWEYACRAGTKTAFSTGNKITTSQANYSGQEYSLNTCMEEFDRGHPVAVGTFKPNAWQLFDMHGNVAEWCQDDYPNFEGAVKIIKGGSWKTPVSHARSAFIGFGDILSTSNDIGIRLARNKE